MLLEKDYLASKLPYRDPTALNDNYIVKREVKMIDILSKDIVQIWYTKKKEMIDAKKKEAIATIIDTDEIVNLVRKHIDAANEILNKNEKHTSIKPNYENFLTKESADEISRIKEDSANEIKKLDQLKCELIASLKLCDGRSIDEAKVLLNYGVTEREYGRIIV